MVRTITPRPAPPWLTPEQRAAYDRAEEEYTGCTPEAMARRRVEWSARCDMAWAISLLAMLLTATAVVIWWAGRWPGAEAWGMWGTWVVMLLLRIGFCWGRLSAPCQGQETTHAAPDFPLVPPNQGSARMRPDDGGWR